MPQRQPTANTRRSFKATGSYDFVLSSMISLLEQARRASARAVNSVIAATYWEIGRRIVEHEQEGEQRASYGSGLLERLSKDLTSRFGRGFSVDGLERMRRFYLVYSPEWISATLLRKLSGKVGEKAKSATALRKLPHGNRVSFTFDQLGTCFPLPWMAYLRLLSVENPHAREFYEVEALRGGWSVRQLDRQVNALFYERTALSRNKVAMLDKGGRARSDDLMTAEEEIKDPLVLEFLGLKDEYSESDMEDALIGHLELFLLELGGDFAFIGRQKRLRIGDEWYRVDLLLFHRGLRCLVVIDLKLGKLTHADAGQMHMYLNYARKHWTRVDENPPVGLILCSQPDAAIAQYALEGLPNKVLAAQYKLALPQEKVLVEEIRRTREKTANRQALQTAVRGSTKKPKR